MSRNVLLLVEDILHFAGEGMLPDIKSENIFTIFGRSKPFSIWPVRGCFLTESIFLEMFLLLVEDIWHLVGEGMFPDIKFSSENVFTLLAEASHSAFGQ